MNEGKNSPVDAVTWTSSWLPEGRLSQTAASFVPSLPPFERRLLSGLPGRPIQSVGCVLSPPLLLLHFLPSSFRPPPSDIQLRVPLGKEESLSALFCSVL